MNFDFVSIENEYIDTSCSYRDLALKNGIPLSTLAAYAKKHNWVDKRRSALCGITENGSCESVGLGSSTVQTDLAADNNPTSPFDESDVTGVGDTDVSDTDTSTDDISKLICSSDALEDILHSAFTAASLEVKNDAPVDTKSLKELTAVLKDAISIKQNLLLLPTLTQQKRLELQTKKSVSSSDKSGEIRVILDDCFDKFRI